MADGPTHPPLKLALGRVVITQGAKTALGDTDVILALGKHARGEWGDLCPEDAQANDAALDQFARILSAYTSQAGTKFWIITEADRSATTVLLPDEY